MHEAIVSSQGMQNTLVIFPIEDVKPRYRGDGDSRPAKPKSINQLLLSPILGAPEIVVPSKCFSST